MLALLSEGPGEASPAAYLRPSYPSNRSVSAQRIVGHDTHGKNRCKPHLASVYSKHPLAEFVRDGVCCRFEILSAIPVPSLSSTGRGNCTASVTWTPRGRRVHPTGTSTAPICRAVPA